MKKRSWQYKKDRIGRMTEAEWMEWRKKEAARRRAWYQALSPERKEEIKASLREYYYANKEKRIEYQRKQRAKARLIKAGNNPNPKNGT